MLDIENPTQYSDFLFWRGSKCRLRPGQIRLSKIFLGTFVLAVLLGLWKYSADQEAPYQFVWARHGKVKFHDPSWFDLIGSRSVSIDLSGTKVTDKDMEMLLRIPEEMEVDLSNTEVSDQVIGVLIRARNLTGVDLSGTQVTEGGLRRLMRARTSLRVGPVSDESVLAW